MPDHDWSLLLQHVSGGSTDTVQQCRVCSLTQHLYSYGTPDRLFTTARSFRFGREIADTDCKETRRDDLSLALEG